MSTVAISYKNFDLMGKLHNVLTVIAVNRDNRYVYRRDCTKNKRALGIFLKALVDHPKSINRFSNC